MDILDTEARTRERFGKGPFSTQKIGREALKRWIEPLAAYLASKDAPKPPRGLEEPLRKLKDTQLAFLALRTIINQIDFGWDRRRQGGKVRKVRNPDMLFRLELGRAVRDELEFEGLLIARKKWVAAKKGPARHAALGKFRRIDWTNAECARAGDWLWDCLAEMHCFDTDERGYPNIADEHKTALTALAEELVFQHPLYMPSLMEPAAWTSWRKEYDDRISATFVKTYYPQTRQAIQTALVDGSMAEHAQAVSAVERVPLKINAGMVPLLREFAGEDYRRDVAVADALGDRTFWNLIRCDFRGRLIHLCDFNYTRGDPVRSLFMLADGKQIADSIDWLEIAVANTFGVKGTWNERHDWVAAERALIKAVVDDPGLLWRQGVKAKEPFGFAAACTEYVAADTHGPNYVTHLPVWLDASSNGLQHLAMMRRDEELAAWVNLAADDGIRDIYEIIARAVRTSLHADDSQFWLSHDKQLRDLLKRPIMTLPYGLSKPGMRRQIQETCADLGINAPFGEIVRLRDHILCAVKAKLPRAIETMEWVQRVADHCLERGTFMEFVSPTGFPVSNRYLKSRTARVKLPFLGQSVTIADGVTDKADGKKAKDSAVANIVHAMDAAHLVRSINATVAEGNTNVLTIHDCFGTLAPDVRRFAQVRRWALAVMYEHANPLACLRDLNLPPGTNDLPLPEFGALAPLAVGNSEYFDR